MMTNRTALITGASRGIGKACAQALSAAGHRVILAARDRARLDELAATIPDSIVVEIDLSQPDSIKEAFRQAYEKAGRIDILVNNAAITRDGLALRMKPADWDAVIQTNLTGSFLCIQSVLQSMMRERWGRIINLSSIVGECGNPGQANYVSSKAGLIGLTKAIAQEMASRNITVNAVAPGFIETDMTAVLSEELRAAMLSRIPLKRLGSPGDVAACVRFLASDEAGYITGHVLDVNGGMYM
ncbi:MAG: 3-oxoacyl-[acyl-carrier-protein] reductase [Bryobacteraceae bacterium]